MDLSQIPPSLVVVAAVGFFALMWLIVTSNRFTHLRNLIRESWSDIDVQLKRRHDLIPNLVETVKGYAAHEQAVLDKVMEARSQAIAHSSDRQAFLADEAALVSALNGLFARVEAYPQLKASEHFLALQHELTNTEDRIAAARRFYNANVRNYNTMCDLFPSSIIAGMRSLSPVPFFEIDTIHALHAAPVEFNTLPGEFRALPDQH